VLFFELTVPFEKNIGKAYKRKIVRYQNVVRKIKQLKYDCINLPVAVGSAGLWAVEDKKRLRQFLTGISLKVNKRILRKLQREMSRIAIKCSYIIFKCRGHKIWNPPDFINCD